MTASKVEVRVGSIILRQDGRNMVISAAHRGGLVSQGQVRIESADVDDFLKALNMYVTQRTEWA